MRWTASWVLLFAAASLSAQTFHIQTVTGSSETSLDSGDGHTWWMKAEPVDPAAEWQRVRAASMADLDSAPGWQSVGVPTYETGGQKADVVWLRKAFYWNGTRPEGIALRLGVISDRDETYVNGRLIGHTGRWDSPLPQAYDRLRIYRVPEGLIQPGVNVILVRVRRYFPTEIGIQKDRTEIGGADQMFKEFYIRNFREAGFLVFYFTAGIYFLFLFVRRRRERENLLFGLFTWNIVIYQFLRTQFKNFLEWDFLFWKQVEYACLFLLFPIFYYFIRTYFDLPRNRLMRIWDVAAAFVSAVQAALAVFSLFTVDAVLLDRLNTTLVQPLWVPLILGSLCIIVYRIIERDRDAIYILGGLLIVLMGTILDILSSRSIINTPRVTGYAFIFFIMSLALVLANRFVRLNETVEDLNKNLEAKVQARTVELNSTLSEVRALKVQQDGDYFLTSLLLKPLNGNHAKSETVTAEMLIEQKKQFQFKKWTAEIGGDVASTYSVMLRGRPCTAVINADAMGKSIQGAGGALVLGTVFKNVVARTQSGEALSRRFPEQWMKECFIELQNVFVSFDGSMMISAVFGLVDDATGLLYYINAEHPYTILYRGGRASFVEREGEYLRKIGVQGLDSALRVGTLQLLPGDHVIMGSDGRDDLAVGTDPYGKRIISEDTDAILGSVERARGDLDGIVRDIKKRGEVTDDLSLLRITYNGSGPRVLEAESLAREAALAGESGEWGRAAELLERAHDAEPGNHAILYHLAAAIRNDRSRERNVEAAAEIAERVRLRQPWNVENLILLAELYAASGNTERAKSLLARARAIDPANSGILKIESQLFS